MNKYCPNCGAKLRSEAKFCSHCGFKLEHISNQEGPTNDINYQSREENVKAQTAHDNSTYLTSSSNMQSSLEKYESSQEPYNGSGHPGASRSLKAWEHLSTELCMGRADYFWGIAYYSMFGICIIRRLLNDGGSLMVILLLFLSVIALMGSIQRIHDTGHSGWWILIPFINFIFLLEPTNWSCTKWKRLDYSNES